MSLLIKNVILNKHKKDLFIKNDKIERISNRINKKADQIIDGKGQKAVLPGLINNHTHAAMSLFRGYADDLPLKQWLKKKIWPLEKKINKNDVYWGTKLACLEMIKTGTTCFSDMYWFEQTSFKAIKEMGLRAMIGLVLLDFDSKGQKEKIKKWYYFFEKNKFKKIFFSIAPHSIYTVAKENLIWAKDFAQRNSLLLHIHLSETEKEVKDCLKKYKVRPVEFLDKIGFLEKNCICAHSIWLSDKEINILKKRQCNIVYNPASNMKLASGIFSYQKINKEGINICLGTDGACSNNNLDMFEEMKIGSLLQKVNNLDTTIAPAKEVFRWATENGAKALEIKAGKIKEGFLADLILVDLGRVCLTPSYNLISDLIYSCSGSCVSDLICGGKILMRERKVRNEKEIILQAKKRIKKLLR